MFWFGKNKKNNKEKDKMATLDEVRKAYEDLSDDNKKAFSQSIQDRVDESLGEQEKDDGTKDTQTAKDREDEALGEEHVDGKGDTKELGETDKPEEKAKEKAEDAHEEEQEAKHEESAAKDDAHEQRLNKIEADIAEIKQMLVNNTRQPKEASEEQSDRLSELARKFE